MSPGFRLKRRTVHRRTRPGEEDEDEDKVEEGEEAEKTSIDMSDIADALKIAPGETALDDSICVE